MLDIAWPELLLIGAVALVAIGPKDLPKAMYTLGQWAGKARSFARDIHRTFEQVAYEAEMAEKKKTDAAASSRGQNASGTASPSHDGKSTPAQTSGRPLNPNSSEEPVMRPLDPNHLSSKGMPSAVATPSSPLPEQTHE